MLVAHLLYSAQIFEPSGGIPWKLNLTAVSSQRCMLFVARNKHILSFEIQHYAREPSFKARLSYPEPVQGDEINAITLGHHCDCEIIVAVYDSGRTVAWKLDDNFSLLWDWSGRVSTWGCAIHGESGQLATSANSHTISVLHMPQSVDNTEIHSQLRPEALELSGHSGNIPYISFSATGKYLVSSSIDSTIRVWSVHSGQQSFVYKHNQWCWAACFVYPFFFAPRDIEKGPQVPSTSSGWPDNDFVDSESLSSHDSNTHNADRPHTSTVDDYTDDIANGLISSDADIYTEAELESDAESELESAANSSHDPRVTLVQPTVPMTPESDSPGTASPMLLCCTRSEVLLLDPALPADAAVVDKIENAVSRTLIPSLIDIMLFDRITFVEWIPEMSVAIVGSFSGTVAVIELQSGVHNTQHRMKVLFRLPQRPTSRQLYGMSIFHHPIDRSKFRAVTLYMTYIDGKMLAYELYFQEDAVADIS
ncbi:hypothetical protein GGI05_003643 [Coemansia sp. RSA 2603]|nr:hypothetical protein GGI05_003643 [Coemansia sp. RSA 2603]